MSAILSRNLIADSSSEISGILGRCDWYPSRDGALAPRSEKRLDGLY
jgi:hypothetical protein